MHVLSDSKEIFELQEPVSLGKSIWLCEIHLILPLGTVVCFEVPMLVKGKVTIQE
jgi:hypothetical protein